MLAWYEHVAATARGSTQLKHTLLCLQNNGVIALTNVSSRQAGYGAAGWLLLWGILGKFGGLILTIPHCVLGGGEKPAHPGPLIRQVHVSGQGDAILNLLLMQ